MQGIMNECFARAFAVTLLSQKQPNNERCARLTHKKGLFLSDVLGYDTWSENINAFLSYPHRMSTLQQLSINRIH